MTDWQRNGPWHNGPWRDAPWRHGPWCHDSQRNGTHDRSSRDGLPCEESKACKCDSNDKSIMQLKSKVKYLERELDWLRKQITEKRHEDLQRDESTHDRSQSKESKPVTHTCCKNDQLIKQLESKVEILERKLDWLHQQRKEKKHEEHKQQRILEYERQRAETKKYKSKQVPSFDSRNESSSKSSSQHTEHKHTEKKWKLDTMDSEFMDSSDVMFKKLDGYTNMALPPLKDSKHRPISTTEVPGINVDIHRNIPAQESTTEIRAISEYDYFSLASGT